MSMKVKKNMAEKQLFKRDSPSIKLIILVVAFAFFKEAIAGTESVAPRTAQNERVMLHKRSPLYPLINMTMIDKIKMVSIIPGKLRIRI